MKSKKKRPKIKSNLHPRNKHRARYDFDVLMETCPDLSEFVFYNKYSDQTIDFFDPAAVKMLNKALLQHYYEIENWDIPENYLCPPIPGRADYLHHIADLLGSFREGEFPKGKEIKCLDIGVGANCVYPIIGRKEYGWSFVGTEIDETAIEAAKKIVGENEILKDKVEIRHQQNPKRIFSDITQPKEYIDVVICNPPFHASLEEAKAANIRKVSHLKGSKAKRPAKNFGGQSNELWCEGGELIFIQRMMQESKKMATSCLLFSTLVSKESNLEQLQHTLNRIEPAFTHIINLAHGNKKSRILTWSFLNEKQRKVWISGRW